MLLSSRPWSWSRVVSRPNLPVLDLVLNCQVLTLGLLTTGLGLDLAFKQDQDLINFYCADRCAYCWKCRDAVRGCAASSLSPGQRFNGSTVPVSTWCTLLSTSCSHGTVFVCTSDICAGWKGRSAMVAYLWGHIMPDWENLCSWSATGTWTTRMCLHGHWTLYQLSCRCSEWFDFVDSVLVLH